MAFTVIVVGDPVLASVAMGNWRNVNYGNALLPVDATGNGVNNTIAAGSTSYRFSNTYSVLGNFSGQITSTLITGTAPFSIASTTKVANLNADFLDDQTGSYYQNSDNQSAGTLPSGRLAGSYTGITDVGTLSSLTVTGNQTVTTGNLTLTAGTFTGNGSGLTTLNATNLSSGTVNTSRIAGSYTGITAVGTLNQQTFNIAPSSGDTTFTLGQGGAYTAIYYGIGAGTSSGFQLAIYGAQNKQSGSAVDCGYIQFKHEGSSADNKCMMEFWTHNGTSVGNRMTLTSAGALELTSKLTATGGIDAGGNGTTLKFKQISIGDWNMDTLDIFSIALGVNMQNVVFLQVFIHNDAYGVSASGMRYDFSYQGQGGLYITGTSPSSAASVSLYRVASGFFDSASFDSTSFNRGYIQLWYSA